MDKRIKLEVTKDILEKLYWEEKLSTIIIAKRFGVVPVTVRNRMKKYGVPIRSLSEAAKNRKKAVWNKGVFCLEGKINPEIIRNLYFEKGFSMKKISNFYDVSRSTIRRYMIRWGIPSKKSLLKKIDVCPEKLRRLYLKEKFSPRQIGEKLGVSGRRIRTLLEKQEIPMRNRSEAKIGHLGYFKCKHHSEEAKRKTSEAQKGERNSFYDKHHSKESKRKISGSLRGRQFSEEHKKNLSKASKGEKNWNWKGGLSSLPYPPEFSRRLKREIRKRDNYTCQRCGISEEDHLQKHQRKLSVHHIDGDKNNNDKSNLVTLCVKCNTGLECWQVRPQFMVSTV